ncbi:hypothetical protein [Gordonia sp. CPCC 205333]|uniref:hypothetical protein n=1 Tax=Gordonia sp. CPCC 205333 TaxID=3140790 RepID=UPI003AF34E3A
MDSKLGMVHRIKLGTAVVAGATAVALGAGGVGVATAAPATPTGSYIGLGCCASTTTYTPAGGQVTVETILSIGGPGYLSNYVSGYQVAWLNTSTGASGVQNFSAPYVHHTDRGMDVYARKAVVKLSPATVAKRD